jgi:predicted glycosyltransferase
VTRCLICTNTPDQVHTFRNLVEELRARDHEVLILARDYTCTIELLEGYGLPYRIYGSHETGQYSLGRFASELPGHVARIARYAREFDPDVVFGRGPYAAFAGTVTGARVNLVLDSEPSDTLHRLSRPFADLVICPESSDVSHHDDLHTFRGFKECAYLHPEVFTSDASVRDDLGLADDEQFVVVRLNSLDAFHDLDAEELTADERQRLIEALGEEATVVVSDESGEIDLSGIDARVYDLHPGRIHDVLAEADLLVAETGTMVIEAAFVGTPAIACGGFIQQEFGEFVALEEQGLITTTTDYDEIVDRSRAVLRQDPERAIPAVDSPEDFDRRRDAFTDELVNLTDLLVDVAVERDDSPVERRYPQSQ